MLVVKKKWVLCLIMVVDEVDVDKLVEVVSVIFLVVWLLIMWGINMVEEVVLFLYVD